MWPIISLLGIYPKEIKAYVHTKACTQIFAAPLFVIAGNNPNVCPQVHKVWYICIIEYYSLTKRNEHTTWMKLKIITEWKKPEKKWVCLHDSYINFQIMQVNQLVKESRLVVTQGWGMGRIRREKLQRGHQEIWGWCSLPWLQWWFHKCANMPKLIKLYILNMCSLFFCQLYLNKVVWNNTMERNIPIF